MDNSHSRPWLGVRSKSPQTPLCRAWGVRNSPYSNKIWHPGQISSCKKVSRFEKNNWHLQRILPRDYNTSFPQTVLAFMSENKERLSDNIVNFSQVKVMADNKLDIWGEILTLLLGQAWPERLFTYNRRTWQMFLLWPEVNVTFLLKSKDDSDPRDSVTEEKHLPPPKKNNKSKGTFHQQSDESSSQHGQASLCGREACSTILQWNWLITFPRLFPTGVGKWLTQFE